MCTEDPADAEYGAPRMIKKVDTRKSRGVRFFYYDKKILHSIFLPEKIRRGGAAKSSSCDTALAVL